MGNYVFKLPDLGEGTVEAEVLEWLVQPGDAVREGDAIANLMTDKANVEVPAPVDGVVLRTAGQPGDLIAVGAELAVFETEAPPALAAQAPAALPCASEARVQEPAPAATQELPSPSNQELAPIREPEEKATPGKRSKVLTSPAIRRRATEAGVNLAEVAGSGPQGRILRSDFDAYLAGRQAPPSFSAQQPAPLAAKSGLPAETEEIKVVGVRRAIAKRMAQSKREIPHFTYVEEVDVTELDALRRHWGDASNLGGRFSLLPFVCAAVIQAAAEFPQCNATYDAESGVMRRHRGVHLGVATQTAQGLKVPVVRNAHQLAFRELAAAIAEAAQAARDGQLPPQRLAGSSITVSSLGKLGGVVSTPIINHPEVAVIGVNKAMQRPAVVNGQVVVRLLMNLSSSFDHRFIDGHEAAAMIQAVKTSLEHPALLFA